MLAEASNSDFVLVDYSTVLIMQLGKL